MGPQLLDLIVTIPDTSPDVCVFPFMVTDTWYLYFAIVYFIYCFE